MAGLAMPQGRSGVGSMPIAYGGEPRPDINSMSRRIHLFLADMLNTLRPLLIALVAASPLLAGLKLSAADPFPPTILRSFDPAPAEGSREDDAGTLAEQCEEDDIEEEQSRVLQVSAASAFDHAHASRLIAPSSGAAAEITRPRLHPSRGPPARR